MNLETITALARKLQAVINPASRATESEQQNAARLLEKLLERHGLTEADLANESRSTYVFHIPPGDQHRKLLVQVVCTVLDRHQLDSAIRKVRIPKLSKKTGKPLASKVPALEVLLNNLTVVEYTDISACYYHYAAILDKRIAELRAEAKVNRMAAANAASALIQRFTIFPATRSGEPPADLTPAEIAALIAAMRGMFGQKWEKPAALIDDVYTRIFQLNPPQP